MKKKDSFLDNLIDFLRFVLGGFGFVALMAGGEAYFHYPYDGLFWKHFKEFSIVFIVLIACYMLWYVFYGHPQAKQEEQQKEQEEQKKLIRWKCEYCGENWYRRNEEGKPYPHSIGRCSRAPGEEHVLYEHASFEYNLETQKFEQELLAEEKRQRELLRQEMLADPEKYGDPKEWGV
jgi:hypothetical protein